jgi:hypothetical protein
MAQVSQKVLLFVTFVLLAAADSREPLLPYLMKDEVRL